MLIEKVQLRDAGEKGLGLFAISLILANEWVWREDDDENSEKNTQHHTRESLDTLDPKIARLAYWDRLKKTFSFAIEDPSSYMNHSCEPNLGWAGEYQLNALRNIDPGEEVTYDYATSDIEGINGKSELHCLCGQPNCRKIIRPDDLLTHPKLRAKYQQHLPPSVQDWINLKLHEEKNKKVY